MSDPSDSNISWLASLKSADELTDEQWRQLDFRQLPQVKTTFVAMRACGELSFDNEHIILHALAHSCAPDQALFALQRWLEAGGATVGSSSDKQALWDEPEFLELMCMLFAATPALSDYFLRFPARAGPALDNILKHQASDSLAWRQSIRETARNNDTYSARLAMLRRMRVECMLQIAALDLTGQATVEDTVRSLSDLADTCIETALDIAVEAVRPRLGILPALTTANQIQPGLQSFVVMALGKLGGRELNYSSDIDLIFVHAGRGETVETSRPVDAATYFTALGEEMIAALDKITDDGRVYRVDLRLRPHGRVGPLVKSVEEMLNYFQTEGRTWERQAWLKARAVAGNLSLGDEFLKKLTPFIFRRYLSLDAIGDMQALKRQIEMNVARRGESEDEIKLGRGGIRDIEFTVQFMQLLYGSEYPHVRGGNTLNALYALRREGLLSDREVEPLSAAYIFLRNVEHRLQLHGDLQVHRLPQDSVARRRIARSLGYADKAADGDQLAVNAQDIFEAERVRHTASTREVFERLFANLFQDRHGTNGQLSDLLLAPQPDIKKIAAPLPSFGFAASESSARELVDLSREKLILTSPSRTRKFFASVAPQILKALVATGEPEDALRRFSRIAGSLGAKAVFYQMLNENPWLLKMTADLAAWSVYLTDILVANPGLFDELVDALQTGQSKTAKEMTTELSQIAVGGDIADTLRAYRAGELLRIGVRDLIHSASLEQTQNELTDLAEAILRIQLEHALKVHRQRHGEVLDANGKPVNFAILGLGKFGGREMNYGSDLDVIFFYGSDGQTSDGLPAVNYFIELAQNLTRALSTPTAIGSLYELDARLRPNGSKGPLALSPDYFKRYWIEGQLADWERLALTRARLVAGDEGVGERTLHLIRSAIYSPLKDTQMLAREVVAMRRRLESAAEKNDLKRGRGGLVDIEFIAQYLQLIHAPTFPPLRQANTEQALKALLKFKKLPLEDSAKLLRAYEFFMRMENRIRIVHGLSQNTLPQKPEALRKLALRTGYADSPGASAEKALQDDYLHQTAIVRNLFQQMVV
ncbi:MAG: bifunctional [glutamate--ammonia ligase]-adenylyl-L-tyrosine phosphorylase/[glutamate--ammonia-ligase] adenylyltransferase [Planctomycetota bacterium]